MTASNIPHLADCIDFTSPYAEKYISIVSVQESGESLVGHHIVPGAFYKYVLGCNNTRRVSSPDMVPANIAHLSKVNHIVAHYYLARCIKHPNNIFTDSQLYAFVNMFSKRIMKNHPLYEEMLAFSEDNKKVKSRYKQYDLYPPTLQPGCTFYTDAVTPHIDRTGAWITQERGFGKEHYNYDHFGNILSIELEDRPNIWLVRSLTDGRILSISTTADDQKTYVGFSDDGSSNFCNNWQGHVSSNSPYRVDEQTYKFADAIYTMSEYLVHILPKNEYSSLMELVRPYSFLWKKSAGVPVEYHEIPAAPSRLKTSAHCLKMVEMCENNFCNWMDAYNQGIRNDTFDFAYYWLTQAQMWRLQAKWLHLQQSRSFVLNTYTRPCTYYINGL